MFLNKNLPDINKNDFDLLPTKRSIARIYVQQLATLSQQKHNVTHEDIYTHLEESYLNIFNQPIPFASFDSFRKFIAQNKKDIY